MRKLLMLSVVISMLAVPLIMARDDDPRRGLRRAFAIIFVFNAFYVAGLALFITSPF